jgi:iron uptake system component EfeO
VAVVLLAAGCNFDNDKDHDHEAEAILAVKDYVGGDLAALHTASTALCDAAPAADADGWSAGTDASAVTAMKGAWTDARARYEHVEGAIAVLFPDLDYSTDARYEDFLAEEGPDLALFDDQGVTGVHGIERVLWSDTIPAEVVAFEEALDGYAPAAFPATKADATSFRDGLCERLVTDTATMDTDFEPLALDSAAAFRGVIGSMEEQLEKVNLAATGEDESRYARYTLTDMRANLDGAEAVYAAFKPWLAEEEGGPDLDSEIVSGFDRVGAAYAAIDGDAIPPVPDGWNPDAPTEAWLATEYGQLWELLMAETDPAAQGALVERMSAAADLLGIPVLP